MADSRIRIGLLGASRIAPGAILSPARERDDVRVVDVAARDPTRAVAFAAEYGIGRTSASYADLIARDDIDLVYVALPPDAHCRWTRAALEAGKAVLCEKPFAMDAQQARGMVDTASRTGSILIEAFHYRFHAMMRSAVALMREGAIGEPVRADGKVCYPIPDKPGEPRFSSAHGGGAVMDLGCYGIHALRALLGCEPEVLSACSRWRDDIDVATDAVLRFGAVDASLHCAMDPPAPGTNLLIEGARGRLEICGFVLPQLFGRAAIVQDGVRRELPVAGPSSYAAQLDHVVRVLRGEEQAITGGGDAVANMVAVDAVRRAARDEAAP